MRLDDICTVFNDGDWIESKNQSEKGIRLIQTGNIGEGKYLEKEERAKYISEETFNSLKCTEIFPGDILVSRLPEPVGRACIIPEKSERMITAVDCTICRPDKNIISKEYLCYFMQSKAYYTQLLNSITGTTRKRISRKNLGSIELNIPDKTTQKSVVEKLDLLSVIIENRKEEIEKLDELIKARFVELFGDPSLNTKGYPIKSLPEIAEYWNGLTYKPEDVDDEGIIVLRSSNIQNAQLDFEDTVRVTCSIGEKKYVQDNDILMCSRNGSARLVGKVALIKDIEEPMSFGAFMMIIRSQYYPYLMTYFQMPAFRAQITTGATTTINQITGRMLDNVKLPVPEKTEMDNFSSFIEQVDKSKVAVQKALDEAQLLFNSLMQEYFG